MANETRRLGMGWLPDYPDFRDYSLDHAVVKPLLKKIQPPLQNKKPLPAKVDLRQWCSAVEDQGSLGSCTAQAGAGLVEYFIKRSFDKEEEVSRLFLYKATRNLMHQSGDTGAFIRTTMGALVLFGVPPEEYWPYQIAEFDKEPPAFCYAFAQNYQTISYYRFDSPNLAKKTLLQNIKAGLVSGLPAMFGFTVFNSISQAEKNGDIPFPAVDEKIIGGHAVVAVGYDDKRKIVHPNRRGEKSTGALLIRNSWGKTWGEEGYGWLPYAYVLNGLAVDWWSILKQEWIETGKFKP
ncbi:MAG TPA: C1 family peptidase [bacterium]|nr:C1 family peptidase [bacterium]